MEFPWCENYCSRFLRFLDFVPHVFTVSAPFIAERWCGSRSFGEAWGTRLLYADNSSISRRRNFLASPRIGIWKKTCRAVRSNERGGGADWICQGIGAYLRAHFEDRISVYRVFLSLRETWLRRRPQKGLLFSGCSDITCNRYCRRRPSQNDLAMSASTSTIIR